MIAAIVNDNLVNRNGTRTPPIDLFRMAELLAVDTPASVDHERRVKCEWGVINSAGVYQLEVAQYPHPEILTLINQQILQTEGYWFILCEIEPKVDLTTELDQGLGLRVSISGRAGRLTCPGCTCAGDLWGDQCTLRRWPPDYVEYRDIVDVYELSRVLVPAVRNARLLWGTSLTMNLEPA